MFRELGLLEVTVRPERLVGRTNLMSQIHDAIYRNDRQTQIVLISGAGGMGKTRLVEEVLRRVGHPKWRTEKRFGPLQPEDNWEAQNPGVAITADVLDFNDIRLHTRDFFLAQLGNKIFWQPEIKFENHEIRKRALERLSDSGAAYTEVRRAIEAAEVDFWRDFLDTAERQRLIIPMDTTEQLTYDSSEWLVKHKLLRPRDYDFSTQQWLLTQIQNGQFENTTLIIAGRDEEGASYYTRLREAVEKCKHNKPNLTTIQVEPFSEEEMREYFLAVGELWQDSLNDDVDEVKEWLQFLSEDKKQSQLMHLVTGGQPIRLAMYTDILIESDYIPNVMQASYANVGEMEKDAEVLVNARTEIEAEFISLLFKRFGLRSRILQTLVRTKRGLNAEQLHFVLDADSNESPDKWQSDVGRIGEINSELDQLLRLTLVKKNAEGRIGLQDEVYRIYDEFIEKNEDQLSAEIDDRNQLYKRLRDWVNFQQTLLQRQRAKEVAQDVARIKIEPADKILNTELPKLEVKEVERGKSSRRLQHLTLEYLYYSLLYNPRKAINSVHLTLANKQRKALNLAEESMIHTETWRVLKNRFTHIFDPQNKSKKADIIAEGLIRTAQQDDAATWILRFVLQKKYDQAVNLAKRIEVKIDDLPTSEKDSWCHPFVKGQRDCWHAYALVYKGALEEGINILKGSIQDIKQLHGDVHLANERVGFTLANCYNTLGYAYTTKGSFRDAVKEYTNSRKELVKYLPETEAQYATVLNNLSRALVERGENRAIRVCEEGLNRRLNLGEWLPIAYSFNTLGLIQNDLYQPQPSLQACAQAYAVAKSINDSRVTGLSLVQVSIVLRRLIRSGDVTSASKREAIFAEAKNAIDQAQQIFLLSSANKELVRQIEVEIERGCLYRDWISHTDKEEAPSIWEARRDNAFNALNIAKSKADELEIERLRLDAQVNIAWTYYYVGDFDKVEQTLAIARELVSREINLPLPHEEVQVTPDYLFRQFSKIYGLYGRIAFDTYFKEDKVKNRDEQLLKNGANVYVQALIYGNYFSPRSSSISTIFDTLYGYLKKLTPVELEIFYRFEEMARHKFETKKLETETSGELKRFLLDCFGDYYN